MLARAPLALPDGLLDELRATYLDRPRAYHHFGHVEAVLEQWAVVADGPGWRQPAETFVAVLFHDAIYRVGATDNERRSAAFARDACDRWRVSGLDLARVEELVLLTAAHGRIHAATIDEDAALFLDCDMAILGAAPAEFERYDAAIAEEHAAVPHELYRAGRAAFLRRLLESPAIYLSAFFYARCETPARANIARALTSS